MVKTIDQTFAGKNLFITGATGFIGRVLLEHLLRCCPNIGNIYVLTRSKRGKSLADRWEKLSKLPLYDKLHAMRPNVFREKIIPIEGNMTELGLGIKDDDLKLLQENVHIVYNNAATVKFNQPLKEAIILNVRAVREVCKIALTMKNLECFAQISTCYSNTQSKVVEEELHPSVADWRKCIEIAEKCEKHQLQVMLGRFMEGFPNTYTFSKRLGENVVYDLLNGKIPNVMLRPSIVLSSKDDPMPGWIDNFNGPMTIFAMCGLGLQRIAIVKNTIFDVIPVDTCAKVFIVAVWSKLSEREYIHAKQLQTDVYNISSFGYLNCNFKEFCSKLSRITHDSFIWNSKVWHTNVTITDSFCNFYIQMILFQIIPSLFADIFLKLFTGKRRLFDIQFKIYYATTSTLYFPMNEWSFLNDKTFSLNAKLLKEDEEYFDFSLSDWDIDKYIYNGIKGSKKYLLHEKEEPNLLRHRLLFALYWIVKIIFYYCIFKFLYYFFM